MDLKQLQSYIAAVKYKSFTIAAEKLGISQPTISTHIRILEEEFGTQLIIRTAKNFQVTQKGMEFYECAQNMVKLRDDMLARWNGKEFKTIRLGVSSIPSAYILPEVLPDFEKKYPDVCFVVNQGDSRDIIESMRRSNYDIGLVGMKVEEESLEFRQFYQDRMILITPSTKHYLTMKEQNPIPLKELLTEPMIVREKGSGSGKSAEQILEEIGIPKDTLSITARINDLESIKNLVAGGLGVSIISEKAVRGRLDSNRLLCFDLPGELVKRQFYIICQKGYILKDYVQEFIDYLLQYYQYQKNPANIG